MRKLILTLCAAAVLVLAAWCGAASGNEPYNPNYPNQPGLAEAIQEIKTLDIESSARLNHIYVNYSNVSSGTVISTVYSGAEQRKEVNAHSVTAQTYQDAWGKMSHFTLDLNNQYAQVAALGIGPISSDLTVPIYVYGEAKDQLTYAVVSGIAECVGNERITIGGGGGHSGSSSWVDNYAPAAMMPKNVTTFVIGCSTYTAPDGTVITMDVAPVISDDRTYIPVRFLAYALGVPENGVQWNETTHQVTISKGETIIGLTIGSPIITVNGTPTTMDVAPYVLDGRTMLPARYVAEPLGATVTWDETAQQIILGVPAS